VKRDREKRREGKRRRREEKRSEEKRREEKRREEKRREEKRREEKRGEERRREVKTKRERFLEYLKGIKSSLLSGFIPTSTTSPRELSKTKKDKKQISQKRN
jgi:hypothetical protein